jgi:hypothetical protein
VLILACCEIKFWRESLTSARILSKYRARELQQTALTTLVQALGRSIAQDIGLGYLLRACNLSTYLHPVAHPVCGRLQLASDTNAGGLAVDSLTYEAIFIQEFVIGLGSK